MLNTSKTIAVPNFDSKSGTWEKPVLNLYMHPEPAEACQTRAKKVYESLP